MKFNFEISPFLQNVMALTLLFCFFIINKQESIAKYGSDSVVEDGLICEDCGVADFLTVKRHFKSPPQVLILRVDR